MNVGELTDHVVNRASERERYIVAIAGPPGAGKSTLATTLHTQLSELHQRSKIIPMDGFHLDNAVLSSRGLLARKGAPETFDAAGFVQLMHRLKKREGNVAIPVFDRDKDLAIAGADIVSQADRILIVEGNYLLIDDLPWSNLREFWDESVFINPGLDILKERLVARWLDQGLDSEQAKDRAMSNDIPNANFVLDNSFPANMQIG